MEIWKISSHLFEFPQKIRTNYQDTEIGCLVYTSTNNVDPYLESWKGLLIFMFMFMNVQSILKRMLVTMFKNSTHVTQKHNTMASEKGFC